MKKSLLTSLFIILLIVIISVIVYFIFGLYDEDLSKADDSVNTNIPTTYEVSGSYVIEINNNLLGESSPSGDESITFLTDNKFTAYVGWGNSVHGTYTINNNIINCTITSFSGEYSPEQSTQATLSFKVIDNSSLEIIEASKTYKIKVSELTQNGWVLTEETKDMFLAPFVKGIKFNNEIID